MMTSSENSVRRLAESIAEIVCSDPPYTPDEQMAKIESLLSEAVEQVKKDVWDDAMSFHKAEKERAIEEARSAAFKEAAEIADEHNGCTIKYCWGGKCGATIADKLRRKASE